MPRRPRVTQTKVKISIETLVVATVVACSTAPPAKPPPEVPLYAKMPHPQGMDLADIAAIFTDPLAPDQSNFAKDCDESFLKLKNSTQSVDERKEGVYELVKKDPVFYHWCFYGKLMLLDSKLKSEVYVDERQKEVLDTFEFLTPVARNFNTIFHDSRYLRWAVAKYQQVSEWIFFKKLDLTPEGTAELVEGSNPVGLWRTPSGKVSVLQKYHLDTPESVVTGGPVEFTKSTPGSPEPQSPSPEPEFAPLKFTDLGPGAPAPTSQPVSPAPSATVFTPSAPQTFSPVPSGRSSFTTYSSTPAPVTAPAPSSAAPTTYTPTATPTSIIFTPVPPLAPSTYSPPAPLIQNTPATPEDPFAKDPVPLKVPPPLVTTDSPEQSILNGLKIPPPVEPGLAKPQPKH